MTLPPERKEFREDEKEIDRLIDAESVFLVYCNSCKKPLYRAQENTEITRAVSLNVMHSHSASFHSPHHVTRYMREDAKIGK